jgi:hypothetical protein
VAGLVLGFLTGLPLAAGEPEAEVEDGGFDLGLEEALQGWAEAREAEHGEIPLRLWEAVPRGEDESDAAGSSLELDLAGSAESLRSGGSSLESLAEELSETAWPEGMGRITEGMRLERVRAREGGLIGSGDGMGGLVDIPLLVRWIAGRVEKARLARRPAGARLSRDWSLRLGLLGESSPGVDEVSVLPLVDGWVAEEVIGSCGVDGRCTIEGLPAGPSVLFVRTAGAAGLVRLPGSGLELGLRLRPLGLLRISEAHDPSTEIRVVDDRVGLVVPVSRWQNAGRGEWVPVSAGSLALLLPEGPYRVQWRTAEGGAGAVGVRVNRNGGAEVLLSGAGRGVTQ